MTRLQARMAALAMLGSTAALAQVSAPSRGEPVFVQLAGPATGADASASPPAPASPPADTAAAPPAASPAASSPAASLITTEALRRARVVDAGGAELGQIVDFVLAPGAGAEGRISHVVVAIGGVLGVGRYAVAVPFSELRLAPAGEGGLRITLPWTEAQLRSVPEWAPDNPASLGLSGPGETEAPEGAEAAP